MDGGRIAILALVSAALVTAVSYVLARPVPPARVDRPGVIPMLGRWAYWITRPAIRVAIFLGITPNGMTVLGLCLTVVAAIAAGLGALSWAAFALVLGSWCDLMDGELARSTDAQSASGAFLDSNVDRLSEIAVFTGIAWGSSSRTAMWAMAALIASMMVSYARARGEGLGAACPPFGMERPHRLVVILFTLIVAGFLSPSMADRLVEATCALLAMTAMGTAALRMVVIYQLLEKKRAVTEVDVQKNSGTEAPAARVR